MRRGLFWASAIGLLALLAACSGQAAQNPDTSVAPNPSGTTTTAIGAIPAADVQAPIIAALQLIPLPGKPAFIDFTLDDLEGRKTSLSDFRGKVVLLNFWATWCPPCKAEMPGMEKLYQTFKDNPDFVMLAVDSQEEASVVRKFIADNQYHFKVLLDSDGQVNARYSVQAIPTTYLIDRQGRVIAGKAGAHDWATPEVAQAIRDLLAR